VQQSFAEDDPSELRRGFDIVLNETSDRPGTRSVTMTPKRRQIREALARLDLWVDEKTALMQAMRMTFANGETKSMELHDVTPNAPVDPAMFTVPK
jgi:outer membrane lipoprotein-sorting protein